MNSSRVIARYGRQQLLGGLLAANLVGGALIGIAWLVAGKTAMVGVAIALAAVILFFTVGQLAQLWATQLPPRLGIAVVTGSFLLRAAVLGAVAFLALQQPSAAAAIDKSWLAIGVVACCCAWLAGLAFIASRQRVASYDDTSDS